MPRDDVNVHPEWNGEHSKIDLASEQEWEPPLEARILLSKIIQRASWDQAVAEEESREDLPWDEMPPVARDFYGNGDDATLQVGKAGSLDVMAGADGVDVTFRQKEEPDLDDPAPST